MTSTARRVLRATAAVTGVAALGVGLAGSAFAKEANVQRGEGLQTAAIDGFSTDSVAPVNQLSGDLTGSVLQQRGAKTASPTDGISAIGQMAAFHFEAPPTTLGTASKRQDPTGLAALDRVGSGGLSHVGVPTAGEKQFAQAGMAPMMNPVMDYAVPAIVGGQRVSTANKSTQGTPEQFGSDNGLPQPVNGPANQASAPVTSSVMPAVASGFHTLSDSTTNDGTTSNHQVQV